MAILPGKRLGPYEIVSAIGAGGMGEVYRARDTRLGRDVAIKVLPESFASDADRLRRFEQEARAIAALNHPNILAVHDIGEQDGTRYIVTELLDGRTLREQLIEGALQVRKALDYAHQISDGLAAAHSRGIVHRDLKPENIFCNREGRVKILDFGLAKQALAQGAHADDTMNGATIPDAQTEPGLVMGTVGYMSPEQVRGRPTDPRSDLFALGAILYEMLSGKRAFRRDTSAETMTAILKEEPPELSSTNPAISPGLGRIVHRCLEKEPAQRFQSASDLGFAFESMSDTTKSVIQTANPSGSAKWRIGATAAGLVIAASVAGWFARSAINPPLRSPIFRRITYRRGTVYAARLAPDGKSVIYTAAWDDGPVGTYITSYEFPESRPVDIGQSVLLSVSSTGTLAILTSAEELDHFEFQGTLSTMPIEGGAPREVLQDVSAADWAPDGQTLAIVHLVSGNYRLEYPVGKVLFETTGAITQPRISRDGKIVAFLFHPVVGDDRGSVMVVDTAGKSKVLSEGWEAEQGLVWSAGGDEVWFAAAKTGSEYSLRATSLFGKTRDVLMGPGGIRIFDILHDGHALVSRNEVRYGIMASIDGGPERDLSWRDTSFSAGLSNDGKQIVFSDDSDLTGGLYSVFLRNTDGSPVVHLGEGSAFGLSPDGAWALSLLTTNPPVIEFLPTGPGQARRLQNPGIERYFVLGWMPDSQQIIFSANEPGHHSRLYIQSTKGGSLRPVTPEGFTVTSEGFSGLVVIVSPDGKRVLAQNENDRAWNVCQIEDGQTEGGKCTPIPSISQRDGPLQWSADGKYVYVSKSGRPATIRRIEIATGRSQPWKQIAPADPVGMFHVSPLYVTPDGKSFTIQYGRILDQLYVAEGLN